VTVQIRHTISFQSRDFEIFCVRGQGLFNPSDLGLRPALWSTACRHGYVCGYSVVGEVLRLSTLDMVLELGDGVQLSEPVPIFGVAPYEWYPCGRAPVIRAKYRDIGAPALYSGGMLIARKLIENRRRFWGYPMIHGYEEVHELLFRRGGLIRFTDCSEILAEVWRENPNLDKGKEICDRCRPGMDLIKKYIRT